MNFYELDYYKIGQRIRQVRKACNLSQEQLADMVDISTTHMSHIETGNTKLSLAVLVKLAQALSVQTDALIFDVPPENKTLLTNELLEILNSCSTQDMYVLLDLIKATKVSLDKHHHVP